MIDYIINNKEWIFSGVGVLISIKVFSFFKNSFFVKVIDSKMQDLELELSQKKHPLKANRVKNDINSIVTETKKVSERFCKVLQIMNENRASCLRFTIARLAEIMNLEKISKLENIFIGKQEPSFQFIEKFSKTFGVNERWLIEGIGTPFSNNLQTKLYPMDYFEMIKNIKPDRIYFVKENSNRSPAFILLKISEWKYLTLRRTWHISDEVGATGQAQLYSFYSLVKKLRNERETYINCNGLILGGEDFNLLLSGQVFPGKFVDIGFTEKPWWDDLTDINHSYPISSSYEEWYGESFIKAQKIVKSHIEYRL
ncbi:helix-turn-helix transcriptional regulator [Francisella sp. Scap27]|uniref:helix-turn-helix domain-containing protein n=1 Tax=Francisella sp. Scap27 TaxID=2589986 RepID=UPI0015BA4745|nr:helix-turn-helix transcriptional regulator [Francisella sp. Scap27]QLE78491.1 helix-turn-helix transcriptional regulator [Francisella sp. Scap27]